MSIKATLAAVRALGLTAGYKAEYREYRVNYKGGKEATAHYTCDDYDAIGTARVMAANEAARMVKFSSEIIDEVRAEMALKRV